MSPGLVFDTTVLTHFARAGRLNVLESITEGFERLTPTEVFSEAQRGLAEHPAIGNLFAIRWITIVELDILETVRAVAFKRELGGTEIEHLGECAVLAVAQARGSSAVIDDHGARSAGRRHGILVTPTLSLIARGIRDGLLDESDAADVVDALWETNMHLPVRGPGYLMWAQSHGLLS